MTGVFRLGIPSPGIENDCNGISFSIEENINQFTPTLINIPVNENPLSCQSDIEPQIYQSMKTDAIEQMINNSIAQSRDDQCVDAMIPLNMNKDLNDINMANERLK